MLTTNVPEIQRTNLASTVLSLKVQSCFIFLSSYLFYFFKECAEYKIYDRLDNTKSLADKDNYMADIKILGFFLFVFYVNVKKKSNLSF